MQKVGPLCLDEQNKGGAGFAKAIHTKIKVEFQYSADELSAKLSQLVALLRCQTKSNNILKVSAWDGCMFRNPTQM